MREAEYITAGRDLARFEVKTFFPRLPYDCRFAGRLLVEVGLSHLLWLNERFEEKEIQPLQQFQAQQGQPKNA